MDPILLKILFWGVAGTAFVVVSAAVLYRFFSAEMRKQKRRG